MLQGLPATLVGAPLGMLIGGIGGAWLCYRLNPPAKLVAGILVGSCLGAGAYCCVLILIGTFLSPLPAGPHPVVFAFVLPGFLCSLVIGALIGGWLCRQHTKPLI
jgi:hypothetical protein